MKSPLLLTGLVVSVLAASLLVPAPARADAVADRKEQLALHDRVMPGAEKDPKAALTEYQKFIDGHPDFTPAFAMYLYFDMSTIHRKYLKDAPAAIADLDKGLAKYPDVPHRMLLVATKGDILNRNARAAEAETMFEEQWPDVKDVGWLATILPPYSATLKLQHKEDKVPALWRGAVEDNLASLGGKIGGTLLPGLIQSLLQNSQEEEALSWSKLAFQVAPFKEEEINKTMQLLVKGWTTKNLSAAAGQEFVKSLQDPKAPNPLAPVPAPKIDPRLWNEQFAVLNAARTEPVEAKITMLIVAGRFREAMLLARRQIVDHPESADGSLQAARVFKAADLNLVRANALLEFIKTGQGENPLIAFFEQPEAAPTVGAPTATP